MLHSVRMNAVESLRRLELKAGKLLKDVMLDAAEEKATLILFGSRASGDHSPLSDYTYWHYAQVSLSMIGVDDKRLQRQDRRLDRRSTPLLQR